jgi:hypothetical protein
MYVTGEHHLKQSYYRPKTNAVILLHRRPRIGGIGKGKETQNLNEVDVEANIVILNWQRSLWQGD